MKLSRNALDIIILRFRREFNRVMTQMADEKLLTAALRKERDRAWKMVETINLARPVHRDYALALCLADYDQEPAVNNAASQAVNAAAANAMIRSTTPSPGLNGANSGSSGSRSGRPVAVPLHVQPPEVYHYCCSAH
jgi:hypothetical protein